MNIFRITFLAFALALLACPAWAATSGLGVAGSFNGFFFNDFSNGRAVGGKLAVGGDVSSFGGYGIGTQRQGASGETMVVGGNMTAGNGTIYGDLRVGGTFSGPSSYNVYTGSYHSGMPSFDFKQEEAYLKKLSSSLQGIAATGSDVFQWGGLSLDGKNTSGLNVFNISSDDLSKSHSLNLSGVAVGNTILINVSGSGASLTLGSNLREHRGNVLFNFYEATELSIGGFAAEGAILAPLADVTGTGGDVFGSLIASSYDGATTLHDIQFSGNVPSPTPIPGAVWLFGSGLAGLVALRRKRS